MVIPTFEHNNDEGECVHLWKGWLYKYRLPLSY